MNTQAIQRGDRIIGIGNPFDSTHVVVAWQRPDATHGTGVFEFRARPAAYREPTTAAA